MSAVPFTWPVGTGKFSAACLDLREQQMRVFSPARTAAATTTRIIGRPGQPVAGRTPRRRLRAGRGRGRTGAATPRRRSTRPEFLAGRRRRCSSASAINNFGVREVLGRAGRPGAAAGPEAVRCSARCSRLEPKFSGVVFKIQGQHGLRRTATAHRLPARPVARSRAAVRMRLKVAMPGKAAPGTPVVTFMSRAPRTAERGFCRRHHRAFRTTALRLATLPGEGRVRLQFTGLPFFAPEIKPAEVADQGILPAAAVSRRSGEGRRHPGVCLVAGSALLLRQPAAVRGGGNGGTHEWREGASPRRAAAKR